MGGGGRRATGGALVRVVDTGAEVGGEDLDVGFLGVAFVEELACGWKKEGAGLVVCRWSGDARDEQRGEREWEGRTVTGSGDGADDCSGSDAGVENVFVSGVNLGSEDGTGVLSSGNFEL